MNVLPTVCSDIVHYCLKSSAVDTVAWLLHKFYFIDWSRSRKLSLKLLKHRLSWTRNRTRGVSEEDACNDDDSGTTDVADALTIEENGGIKDNFAGFVQFTSLPYFSLCRCIVQIIVVDI